MQLSGRLKAKAKTKTKTSKQRRQRPDLKQPLEDGSNRAHTLHTTLSATQEAILLSLRQSLYLPLDDLLYITRGYINAAVSRAGTLGQRTMS